MNIRNFLSINGMAMAVQVTNYFGPSLIQEGPAKLYTYMQKCIQNPSNLNALLAYTYSCAYIYFSRLSKDHVTGL